MDINQALSKFEMAIGQGEVEKALEMLVSAFQSDEKYEELLRLALVNQADFFENKREMLAGTRSVDEARKAINQITDRTLELSSMARRGQFSFAEKVSPEAVRRSRWQYFLVGAIALATVAAIYWRYFSVEKSPCPEWASVGSGPKVMLLPFLKLSKDDSAKPEIEIKDGLEDLAAEKKISAQFDVNEDFVTEKEYPSIQKAAELASGCGADMIVWGKVTQKIADQVLIDVKYCLVEGGAIKRSGTQSLTRFLVRSDAGDRTSDLAGAAQFLLGVLASRLDRTEVAVELLEKSLSQNIAAPAGTDIKTSIWGVRDTLLRLEMGFALAAAGQPARAVEHFDQVLEANPTSLTALQNRGVLNFQAKNFEKAAIDLEAVEAVSQKPISKEMLKMRASANVESGRKMEAERDLASVRKGSETDQKWAETQQKQLDSRLLALETEAKKEKRIAESKPTDARANLRAARSSQKIGRRTEAAQFAQNVVAKDPGNPEAWAILLTSAKASGDSARVQKTVESAQKEGVTAKDVGKFAPKVAPLLIPKN